MAERPQLGGVRVTRERVWDRFLTEQDRASVEAARDGRVGLGERPALLLVDLYRWVFGDQPEPLLESMKTWPGSCGLAGWNALPSIQRLLAAAREAGIPVVHLTGLDGVGVAGWREAIHAGQQRQAIDARESRRAERQARRYQIVDEVAPIEGEAVLRKTAPSAFWGTPLIGHLHHLGVDSLIVAGESTSGCVRATVVDGASHRFKVTVVEECVFDRHEAAHAINLFDMHQKYGDVRALDEVLDFLRAFKGGQANGVAQPGRLAVA
ncbi:MAG: isochorismatase family protein [Chloroflexi bacterium]|nr:isochorismatase family protein [Chloroflexota bacterium]